VPCFFLVEGNLPPGLKESSKRNKRLLLSVVVPVIIGVFALTCTITCVYVWRRKMAKEEGKGLAFHNAHNAQSEVLSL
jgi:hypothetical protein